MYSKSEYTRCKLPRLVIDESCLEEREKDIKRLEEGCQKTEEDRSRAEEMINETGFQKRGRIDTNKEPYQGRLKRRKYGLMSETWGAKRTEEERQARESKTSFLMERREQTATVKTLLQPKLKVMTDAEWVAREIMNVMVERAWLTLLQHQAEDSQMWSVMDELDKKQVEEDKAKMKSNEGSTREMSGKITDWVEITPRIVMRLAEWMKVEDQLDQWERDTAGVGEVWENLEKQLETNSLQLHNKPFLCPYRRQSSSTSMEKPTSKPKRMEEQESNIQFRSGYLEDNVNFCQVAVPGVLPAQRKVEEDDLPLSEVDREAFEDPPAGELLGQSTMTLDKTKNDTKTETDTMTNLEMTTSNMGPGKQIKAKVPKLGLSKGSRVVRKSRYRKPAAGERKKNLEKMRKKTGQQQDG